MQVSMENRSVVDRPPKSSSILSPHINTLTLAFRRHKRFNHINQQNNITEISLTNINSSRTNLSLTKVVKEDSSVQVEIPILNKREVNEDKKVNPENKIEKVEANIPQEDSIISKEIPIEDKKNSDPISEPYPSQNDITELKKEERKEENKNVKSDILDKETKEEKEEKEGKNEEAIEEKSTFIKEENKSTDHNEEKIIEVKKEEPLANPIIEKHDLNSEKIEEIKKNESNTDQINEEKHQPNEIQNSESETNMKINKDETLKDIKRKII